MTVHVYHITDYMVRTLMHEIKSVSVLLLPEAVMFATLFVTHIHPCKCLPELHPFSTTKRNRAMFLLMHQANVPPSQKLGLTCNALTGAIPIRVLLGIFAATI